jgi:hypothetical protein
MSLHVVPGDHLAVVHQHLDELTAKLARYLGDAAQPPRPASAPAAPPDRSGMPLPVVDFVLLVTIASRFSTWFV